MVQNVKKSSLLDLYGPLCVTAGESRGKRQMVLFWLPGDIVNNPKKATKMSTDKNKLEWF